MRVVIKIGECFARQHSITDYEYFDWKTWEYVRDFDENISKIYQFFRDNENIMINNADMFVTYLANNCILRNIIDSEPEDKEGKELLERIPILTHCVISEIHGDEEILPQDGDGNLTVDNWFDNFLTKTTKDFDSLLNYYKE
jgi:hypothetical protein